MKSFTAAFLLAACALTSVSCSQSSASATNSTQLALSPEGLTANSRRFSRPVIFEQLKAALGKPSRFKTNSSAEAAEKKRKFGTAPNDLYTYDDAGIILYHKPGAINAASLAIEFKGRGYSFSPARSFNGTLLIGGKSITSSTTLSELKLISGMQVGTSPIRKYPATYGQHSLTLDFGDLGEPDQLVDIGIELGAAEKTNPLGWTANEIAMMETMFSNADQLQQVAAKFNVKPAALAHCFAQKVSQELAKDQLASPNEVTKARLQAFMESCVAQASAEHK